MRPLETDRFEELVGDALADLPDALAAAIDNVAIILDDASPPVELLGLYEGIPLTERDEGYSFVMPDRITIFVRTICDACDTEAEVVATVRDTVIHEIAHHFGIDDDRLDELGWS
jgi:predicted Zn-dependent protease with MMP-like domain